MNSDNIITTNTAITAAAPNVPAVPRNRFDLMSQFYGSMSLNDELNDIEKISNGQKSEFQVNPISKNEIEEREKNMLGIKREREKLKTISMKKALKGYEVMLKKKKIELEEAENNLEIAKIRNKKYYIEKAELNADLFFMGSKLSELKRALIKVMEIRTLKIRTEILNTLKNKVNSLAHSINMKLIEKTSFEYEEVDGSEEIKYIEGEIKKLKKEIENIKMNNKQKILDYIEYLYKK